MHARMLLLAVRAQRIALQHWEEMFSAGRDDAALWFVQRYDDWTDVIRTIKRHERGEHLFELVETESGPMRLEATLTAR